MRFSYQFLRLPSPDPATGLLRVARPIIPITLSPREYDEPRYALRAPVDSGSDWSLFDEEAAQWLGIDILSGESRGFLGVEQVPMNAFFHNITLDVGGIRVPIRAGFVRGFRFSHGILGQAGFFDQFVVTISAAGRSPYIEMLRAQ